MILLAFLLGGVLGTLLTAYVCSDILKNNSMARYKSYFNFLVKWIEKSQYRENHAKWFEENGYKNICIYGMAEIAKCLIDELQETDVHIVCGIDKRPIEHNQPFPVYKTKDITKISESFDVVIVTAFFYYDDIKEEIEGVFSCPIISIEEVI